LLLLIIAITNIIVIIIIQIVESISMVSSLKASAITAIVTGVIVMWSVSLSGSLSVHLSHSCNLLKPLDRE